MHSWMNPGCEPRSGGAVMYIWGGNFLGKTNYTGVAGPGWIDGCTSAPAAGGFNYQPYKGIFNNRSNVKLNQIIDGTSNTLMFGEGLGGSYPGSRDFQWTWIGVGAMATFGGIKPGTVSPSGAGNNSTETTWASFNSLHTNSVHFCFADGSVRGLRQGGSHMRSPPSLAFITFQALAGYADGDNRTTGLE
jgi:prepilin-type processing-associated H-X9-DG protein